MVSEILNYKCYEWQDTRIVQTPLVHALLETTKSTSSWANHKMFTPKDHKTDNEEEEQETETQRSVPQVKEKGWKAKVSPDIYKEIVGPDISSREMSSSLCKGSCAD